MLDIAIGSVLVVAGVALGAFKADLWELSGGLRWWKACRVAMVALGVAFLTGIVSIGGGEEGGSLAWRNDVEAALREARTAGRPAILDAGAEWCGACKDLEHRTLKDPDVVSDLDGWVAIRVDMTDFDPAQERLAALGLDVPSLPQVFFFMPDGRVNPGVTLRDFEGPGAFRLRIVMAAEYREEAVSPVEAWIAQNGMLVALLLVFAAGLATSLTPCVYPMIPITLSVVGAWKAGGDGEKVTFGRRAVRSAVFVAGLVAMYTLLGVVAAVAGKGFGSWLQHGSVTAGITVLFTSLAFSYLGFFRLDLPESWKRGMSARRAGLAGVALVGAATGVVAAPCAGPVVVAILAMIGSSGDITLGTVLMLAFGLGLGTLFFVLGLATALLSRLPRGGGWMERVEIGFATAFLVVAIYYGRLAIGF